MYAMGVFCLDFSASRQFVLQMEHDELKKKIHVLQKFVKSNVGVLPPILLPIDQSKIYFAGIATKLDAVSLPVPSTPVRNGVRWTNNKLFLSIRSYNRFKILAEDREEDYEPRFIGDSIVREQLQEFYGRTRATKKRMCTSEGRLDDISAACGDATSIADD